MWSWVPALSSHPWSPSIGFPEGSPQHLPEWGTQLFDWNLWALSRYLPPHHREQGFVFLSRRLKYKKKLITIERIFLYQPDIPLLIVSLSWLLRFNRKRLVKSLNVMIKPCEMRWPLQSRDSIEMWGVGVERKKDCRLRLHTANTILARTSFHNIFCYEL